MISKDGAELIQVVIPKKAGAFFYVMQVTGGWLCVVDCEFHIGDYSGSWGPFSERQIHFSRRDALAANIGAALRHFHDGLRVSSEQVRVSLEMRLRLRALLASLSGADGLAAAAGMQLALF